MPPQSSGYKFNGGTSFGGICRFGKYFTQVDSNWPPKRLIVTGSPKGVSMGKKLVKARGKPVENLRGKQNFIVRRSRRVHKQVEEVGKCGIPAPGMPTVEDCWLHFFVVRQYESWNGDKDKPLPEYLSGMRVFEVEDYTGVSQRSSWRLRDGKWLDSCIIDNFLMHLQMKESTRPFDGDRRVWYWGTFFSEMGYIAVPMNVKDTHWFMMVISFVGEGIFILDSWSGLCYNEGEVKLKIQQIHRSLLNDEEYRTSVTPIASWDVSFLNDDVPQQPNSEMGKSPWNHNSIGMNQTVEELKRCPHRQAEFAKMYHQTPSLYPPQSPWKQQPRRRKGRSRNFEIPSICSTVSMKFGLLTLNLN